MSQRLENDLIEAEAHVVEARQPGDDEVKRPPAAAVLNSFHMEGIRSRGLLEKAIYSRN